MLPVRAERELPCNSVGGSGIRQGLVIPALPANHSQPLVASALALSRCDRNSYILTLGSRDDSLDSSSIRRDGFLDNLPDLVVVPSSCEDAVMSGVLCTSYRPVHLVQR